MCGRFALKATTKDVEKLQHGLISKVGINSNLNIAPTQDIAVILNSNPKQITTARWGLIPFWAKDKSIGNQMINARCETLSEKPSFKNLIKQKRCLIPATGFYEWKAIHGTKNKQAYHIHLKTEGIFTFAGLWDTWKDANGEVIVSATIITTASNLLLSEIHDRMPVIISNQNFSKWLNNSSNPLLISNLLVSYNSEEMTLEPFDFIKML
jgi:putative SOS response-associated peptidase YedK